MVTSTWLCPYCNAENDDSFTNCEGCDKSANQQKQAINQYLLDKRYFVTIEACNSRLAIFSGLINTKTGTVDTQASIHWRYFGKQASRTVYYACRKVSETVYTW